MATIEKPINAILLLCTMQQLYLIRHGNADYLNNCLTPNGVEQVRKLASKLENRLPTGVAYILVSSNYGRAIETAKILEPCIKTKSNSDINLHTDESFGELASFDLTYKPSVEIGMKNVRKIGEYFNGNDVIIITSHLKIIGATSYALGEHYGIEILPELRGEGKIINLFVRYIMEHEGISREEAIKRVVNRDRFERILSEIGEANAIFFDLEHKVTELIKPE